MEEELELYLDEAKEGMDKAITHLTGELAKIRAGKAMPNMLDGLLVPYYGNPTPINQMASVSTPDARTLMVKPWEKTVLGDIEKAIMDSDLGITPQNDGEQIRLNIPPLTEERRQQLVKQVKNEGEQAKISIRNSRKEANDAIKKMQKDGLAEDAAKDAEDQVQKLTDTYSTKVEDTVAHKEKELLTV